MPRSWAAAATWSMASTSQSDLLAEAKRSPRSQLQQVSFAPGTSWRCLFHSTTRFLSRCSQRFVEDDARALASESFGRALRAGGILILDVREWDATAVRKARGPLFRRRVDTRRGKLTCTSTTEIDEPTRRLMVSERHTLEIDGRERSSDNEFVMRCWTPTELQSLLSLNGFRSAACFGAYDPGVAPGATDRLVAVAQFAEPAA